VSALAETGSALLSWAAAFALALLAAGTAFLARARTALR
jgi:LPXTG-motif cell wall-anchored protein